MCWHWWHLHLTKGWIGPYPNGRQCGREVQDIPSVLQGLCKGYAQLPSLSLGNTGTAPSLSPWGIACPKEGREEVGQVQDVPLKRCSREHHSWTVPKWYSWTLSKASARKRIQSLYGHLGKISQPAARGNINLLVLWSAYVPESTDRQTSGT